MFGHKLAHACGSIAALFLITSAQAQVSMTALNTPLTQNFDSLANAGTTNAWANNSTLPGWYVLRGAAPPEPTNYAAGDGTPNATFGLYSLGPTGSTDRALGAIISNGFAGNPGAVVYAVRLTNNTGADITSLQIGYTGEQWQRANNAAAQSLNVAYVVASAGTTTPPTSGWTDLNSLTFTSVLNGATAGAATDGNANRAHKLCDRR